MTSSSDDLEGSNPRPSTTPSPPPRSHQKRINERLDQPDLAQRRSNHISPWYTPGSTVAATIQPHDGAKATSANAQPTRDKIHSALDEAECDGKRHQQQERAAGYPGLGLGQRRWPCCSVNNGMGPMCASGCDR